MLDRSLAVCVNFGEAYKGLDYDSIICASMFHIDHCQFSIDLSLYVYICADTDSRLAGVARQ